MRHRLGLSYCDREGSCCSRFGRRGGCGILRSRAGTATGGTLPRLYAEPEQHQAGRLDRSGRRHAPRLLVRQGLFGALSPDGRWVAYNRCLASRERCQTGNAPFALFLIATVGGKPRLLARSTSYPTWSPRSDRIVALRKNRLVSIDLDGNLRMLERSPATAGWSFSPDGEWLVYAKARQHTKCASDLFIVRASGGDERRLTRGRDIFPVWGRRWIAFSRYPRRCAYARRIWRIHPDGSDMDPVTGPPPRH